jgi:PAS domain S-box-containing protein
VTELLDPQRRDVALWPEILEHQLGHAPPGVHICPIYRSPAERLRVLLAFFRGGLHHGEQCLYFADPDRAAEVAGALEALGAQARTELERGALLLVASREQYVRNGHFEPGAMIDLQDAMTSRARSSGFAALRIAGEMSWVLGADIGSERFLEYEARLNRTPPMSGRSVVCQYGWHENQAPVIRDVLRTHPVAIIDERMHCNMYYEPIDMVLGRGDVHRARTERMVRLLQEHTNRVTALFDLGRLTLDGASPGPLMAAAPALIAVELHHDDVQVFELLPSGDAVQLVGSFGSNRVPIGSIERLTHDSLFSDAGLRAGEPVVILDGQDEIRFKLPAVLREAGATGYVSVVISVGHGERVYGFLSVHSRAPRVFSDDEILFLEAVGHLLASAFASARSALSYRALVENAHDMIVRFGGDLRIISANPAIERLTGTAAASLIGKTSADLGIQEPLVPRWELLLGQVWRTGREQTFELTVPTPTDQRVFESRIVPESGADGAVQSKLSVTDRTQAAVRAVELGLVGSGLD